MSVRAIGRFTVLGTLGQGAHSSILHIRCASDGKQYALKVVPIKTKAEHKFLEQAKHEFRVAQMLDHANLIKIYALETPRDWLFRVRKVDRKSTRLNSSHTVISYAVFCLKKKKKNKENKFEAVHTRSHFSIIS